MKLFSEIWREMSPLQKNELATRMGSSYRALGHVASGERNVAPKRVPKILEALKAMKIRANKHSIRPDLW